MSVPDAKFTKGEFEVSMPCGVPGGHLGEGRGESCWQVWGRSSKLLLRPLSSSTSSYQPFPVPISQMSKPGHRVAWLWALADGVWRRGGGSPPLLALLLGYWPPSCLGNIDDHLTGTWDPAVVGDPGAGPRTAPPHPHFNSGHWMDSANISHLATHVSHLMCLMSSSLTPCK